MIFTEIIIEALMHHGNIFPWHSQNIWPEGAGSEAVAATTSEWSITEDGLVGLSPDITVEAK
jgi:hypothetical protein